MVLLDHLITQFPTTKRTTLRRMIEAGRVLINGLPARRAKDPVADSDKVEVLDAPQATEEELARGKTDPADRLGFEIVHEDDDVIVILKPPDFLTATNLKETRATIAGKLETYFGVKNRRWKLGVIHRLDRGASGLLIFTKNTKAYHHLKAQFFHHTVDRVYTAVIQGVVSPNSGRIRSLLVERNDGMVIETDDPRKGQEAITDYETLATAKWEHPMRAGKKTISLLKVTLLTGRKHQIRAHFAAKGCPIMNDPMYGPDDKPHGRLLLAATELAFEHPTTRERLKFTIKPPKEVNTLFAETPNPAESSPS